MHGNVCAIGTAGSETTELTSHVASSKFGCSELPQTTKLKGLVTAGRLALKIRIKEKKNHPN